MRKPLVVLAVFAFAAGVVSLRAAAQVPASQRTLVTDPDLLAKMGFPRDATNVYVANGVLAARAPEAPADPDFYGPNTSFTGLAPKSFVGRQINHPRQRGHGIVGHRDKHRLPQISGNGLEIRPHHVEGSTPAHASKGRRVRRIDAEGAALAAHGDAGR